MSYTNALNCFYHLGLEWHYHYLKLNLLNSIAVADLQQVRHKGRNCGSRSTIIRADWQLSWKLKPGDLSVAEGCLHEAVWWRRNLKHLPTDAQFEPPVG